MSTGKLRFPIRFDNAYSVLSTALLLPPSSSYVEIEGNDVTVRMGWGFRASFARSAVRSTAPLDKAPLSRGVHGWRGRWLVNGSGSGILVIDLSPPQRAHVLGFPVRLRQLMVSVEDPLGLSAALGGQGESNASP
jgi:hypothetical protein